MVNPHPGNVKVCLKRKIFASQWKDKRKGTSLGAQDTVYHRVGTGNENAPSHVFIK